MNIIRMMIPYANNWKANDSIRNIKRTKRAFQKRQWQFDVTHTEQLSENIERVVKEISYQKRKQNRNQLQLILKRKSSEIHEVLQLFLTLPDLEAKNELSQTIEQLVIHRANYVFQELLDDIRYNEEAISGKYIPAN